MPEEAGLNALLLSWVKEEWDIAKERNYKGVHTYRRAYQSLKDCPVDFEKSHPSCLKQLKFFGPKLCQTLTDRMKQHCEETGKRFPTSKKRPKIPVLGNDDDNQDDAEAARPAKRARTKKAYVPQYRSGAYALLMALSSQDRNLPASQQGMTKDDLKVVAQEYCDASFTVPADVGKLYTAWKSMDTLTQKELVYERGRPLKRYCLTEEGWEVATKIRETALAGGTGNTATTSRTTVNRSESPAIATANIPKRETKPQISALSNIPTTIVLDDDDDDEEKILPPKSEYADLVADGPVVADSSVLPKFTPARLMPGQFTVELVLDNREVRAKTDRDYIKDQLTKRGVRPIMRSLELGDFLWVAKCKQPNFLRPRGAEGDEVVLDYIIERKRLDDFIGSIKDGRFHEQKFRLRRSGVKNVIYIVEELTMDKDVIKKYNEALESAMASMQVLNGFFLKRTEKLDDTIRYLVSLTKMLKKAYESKPLFVIPTEKLTGQNYLPLLKHLREKSPSQGHYISYEAFSSLCSKSKMMTLRDLYLKMLMCTKGVTGEKAIEIQKIWKTPSEFLRAYRLCGSGAEGKRRQEDMVFAKLDRLVGRKKIGKPVSKKIAQVWGNVE